MKRIVPLLLLALAFTASAAKQNILLIIADDYGVDSSSLYNSTNSGATLPPTPNIASLATNGVVFRNAYANPVCSPTRSCILTGQHGFRTGVGDVVGGGVTLTTSAFTLPAAFTNAAMGYNLSQFGKWHLATPLNSPRTVGGWTNYLGCIPGQVTDYYNWTKTVNGVSFTSTNYATSDLVDDATNWISARGTNIWFVWAAFNAPHTPNHLPPTNLCPHYSTLPTNQAYINSHPRPYFEAAVEALDTEIGRLLTVVNRTNTHIIFLGDNGTLREVIQPPFVSTRGKDTLYEGGIHVPLIISSPLVVQPNRTNDTLANMVDVFATILEMAGTSVTAAVPSGVTIDSRSLLAVLQSTNTLSRLAYAELFGTNAQTIANGGRVLRDDRYKLIRFTDGHDEFYDLQTDPVELTNLNNTLTATQRKYRDRLIYQLGGYSTNTPPRIASASWTGAQLSLNVTQAVGSSYALWRCDDLATKFWTPITNAVIVTNAPVISLSDTSPPAAGAFYSVMQQ